MEQDTPKIREGACPICTTRGGTAFTHDINGKLVTVFGSCQHCFTALSIIKDEAMLERLVEYYKKYISQK